MKKETLIAIFFGFLLGGVLAVIIIARNKEKQLEKTKTITSTTKITPVSSAANTNLQTLEIEEPADGVIFSKNSVKIRGKSEKESLIVIQSPIKDLVFKNKEREFTVDFPLALGENVIKISAYPKDVQLKVKEKDLKVYYFDEQL